jgi:Fe-S-cluster-containing dehydrogenase component
VKSALLIDYKYCNGCNSCVIACRNEKELDGESWGIALKEIGPEKINGKWMWNFLPYLSDNCDLCKSRVNEGKKPSCVHHCLSQCMELVTLDELPKRMDALGGSVVCYVPQV